jgi:hypothetical protein
MMEKKGLKREEEYTLSAGVRRFDRSQRFSGWLQESPTGYRD